MEISKCFLTENDCYKQQRYITPKGIMVHSTGANNPNLRRYVQPNDGVLGDNPNNNDWNRPNVKKCVHAFIGKDINGKVEIYQTLPWNMRGWHAGANANNTHISFEVCEDNLKDKEYFNTVYQKAIELCVYLCKLYNLSTDNIIDHSEGYKKGIATNHSDISHWLKKYNLTMSDFRDAVKSELGDVKMFGYKKESGVHFIKIPIGNFKIVGWNKVKKTTAIKNYCNAGFFASGKNTTEPMGNLIIDGVVKSETINSYGNLARKKLHTIAITKDNKVELLVCNQLERNKYKYAISGLPVTLDGQDVSWSKVVKLQGWYGGELRPTKHICISYDNDNIYIFGITTKNKTPANAITEIWRKLKYYNLPNILLLDGGGSYVIDINGKNVDVTSENRRVNNLITFS